MLFVPLLDLQLVGTSPELHGRLNCICKVHMYKDPTCKDPNWEMELDLVGTPHWLPCSHDSPSNF